MPLQPGVVLLLNLLEFLRNFLLDLLLLFLLSVALRLFFEQLDDFSGG